MREGLEGLGLAAVGLGYLIAAGRGLLEDMGLGNLPLDITGLKGKVL
jgi:hypothetical protein